MRIGFIGAGKVGKTLGQYFKQNKLNVIGYYSKSFQSATEGAEVTDSKALKSIEEIVNEAEMLFITTTDDAIAEVASQISDTMRLRKDHIVIHTSGVHSSDALEKFEEVGCGLYSIHPLQSFADSKESVANIDKTHFTVEGNGIHLDKILELFQVLNNSYYLIDKKQKGVYHAGACVISNYLVTLMSIGFELAGASGFPSENIYSAFAPLIHSTLENIKEKGPTKSLTGPIARGDMETIKKHLKVIKELNCENFEFYKFMGNKTLEMLEKENVLDEKKKEIKTILMEA